MQLCKRCLLDYNDKIEIVLTEDIKVQVIEYKNIIKNNKKMAEIKKLYCRFVTGMTVDLDIKGDTKTV